MEKNENEIVYMAVDRNLLQKMLHVISNLPYSSINALMKEIETTEFKQIKLEEEKKK